MVLGLLPDVEVVGSASDGDEAVALAADLLPDIVLMDLRMPRCDGVEATRQLRDRVPETKVVVLTTYADDRSVMDALRALGVEVWFNLGDRDLAWCLERARMLAEGLTPTAALARLNGAIGVRARVLPMSDDSVHTWVQSSRGWRPFQEFMIRERAAGPIDGLEFRGAEQAAPSEQVLAAIAHARAIFVGPSNPLASIAPILAVPGVAAALAAARAPVVAVSPIVGGEVLKGPTASFMAFAALPCNAEGVAQFYGELLDGIVADEHLAHLPTLQIDTRMDDAAARARVAERALSFANTLGG